LRSSDHSLRLNLFLVDSSGLGTWVGKLTEAHDEYSPMMGMRFLKFLPVRNRVSFPSLLRRWSVAVAKSSV